MTLRSRSTNTSPTSDLEEQVEEVIIPSIKPQAGITQADTQEETLQLEDTGIKKVHTPEDQNTGPTEAQNTGDIDEKTVPDLDGSQNRR